MAVAASVYALPASAQFFPFDDRFFNPPVQRRPVRPPAPQEDFSRAPAAKQPEAAPSIRILVIGDSMADWLAYGLEEQLSETPEIGIVRKPRPFSGLIRYEQRSDAEWAKVARELIAQEKPQAIVMLVGLQDRQAIREKTQAARPAAPAHNTSPAQNTQPIDDETPPTAAEEQQPRSAPGGVAEFRSEKWEELYGARVDEMVAVLKTANVPVLWVGVPAVRGTKSTSDLQYLNDIVKPHIEKAGLIYVDVWDGFVDERNNYMQRGPDVDGQIRQLRTADGVHFTRFGARKLAHYVERDLRRVLREPVPAAFNKPADPVPAVATPGKPAEPEARPLAGPVILLGSPLREPEELLGGSSPKNDALDAQASKMLVKGEPMSAEAGRADDFSWPPRQPVLAVREELPPTGAPLAIVRAHQPPPQETAAAKPAARPSGPRVAGQQVLQGQMRPQAQQAPTFWRRIAPDSGPRFFFGLFGGR